MLTRSGMQTCQIRPLAELPVGHDPCERWAELCGGTLCELAHWGRRWSSLWDTIRVNGVPKWARRSMNTLAQKPYVELRGAIRVRGVEMGAPRHTTLPQKP